MFKTLLRKESVYIPILLQFELPVSKIPIHKTNSLDTQGASTLTYVHQPTAKMFIKVCLSF